MTDITAGIGLAQLKRYPDLLMRRRQIVGRYNEAFRDLPVALLNHYGKEHTSNGHPYMTRLIGRTDAETREVIVKMAERGVACNVHYKPLPMMTAYKALGFDINEYPNAYRLYENEVTLPLYTKLSDDDVEYVAGSFVDIVSSLR
jgi:dTDP-4-amino-4,6-dideoxygalactose transaminase